MLLIQNLVRRSLCVSAMCFPRSCCLQRLHADKKAVDIFFPRPALAVTPMEMYELRCRCILHPKGPMNLQGSVLADTSTAWGLARGEFKPS